MSNTRLSCLLWAPLALLGAGQTPTRPDLTTASLEDLMQIEVTSVSKKEQKLNRVAAAVYVLTHEDIRRSGYSSLPETLRMVPGLQVARIDGSKWAISARGFNGQYANKLLVLIDGRSVYTPLFSGVYWDLQNIPLEDVERIEVIRGPGATMWGANAVNGVINIITRHTRDTQGGLASVGAGTEEMASGMFRYGGKAGSQAHYRAYLRHFERDELADARGGPAADDWNVLRSGFRMDWDASPKDAISVHGDLFRARNGQRINSFLLRPPYAETVKDRMESSGGYFLTQWTHRFSERSDMGVQFYYDRSDRRDLILGALYDTLDFDFQHRYAVSGRQELVWGLGHRTTRDQVTATRMATLNPDHLAFQLTSAFVQDEIVLAPERLFLTLGTKLEHNSFTGFEIQPTAKLLWSPERRHAVWASVSRGVRTPSRGERYARLNLSSQPGPGGLAILASVFGNPALPSETLLANEAGYRFQPVERLSFDVAAFYNQYRHLLRSATGNPVLDPVPVPHLVVPVRLESGNRSNWSGLEVSAQWTAHRRWKLAGSYTGLRTAPPTSIRSVRIWISPARCNSIPRSITWTSCRRWCRPTSGWMCA
jgi:iron complex outermembrane receptor protein